MFTKGDRIHLHDGTLHVMQADGLPPRRRRKSLSEAPKIRGFIRGALVDMDGTEHPGDWHENIITSYGHGHIVRNFVGLANSSHASFWGLGQHTEAQSSNFSTQTVMSSEYGTQSNSTVNQAGASRANVAASQALAGAWTLSQSWQYASSHISNNVVLNCLAQYAHQSIGSGTAISLATFASSSKSNSQALNITYNWSFGT